MAAPSSLPPFFLPSLSSFLPLFLACACVVCAHMCMCRCTQRLEMDIGCSALSFSFLFPWDRVSHWTGVTLAACKPRSLSFLPPTVLGFQVCAQQSLTLHMGTGDLNPSIHAYTANILTHLNSWHGLISYPCFLSQVEIILAVKT